MMARAPLVVAASTLIACATSPTPVPGRGDSTSSETELHAQWLLALVKLEEHEPVVDRRAVELRKGILLSSWSGMLTFVLGDYELVYAGGEEAELAHWPQLETEGWPEELRPEHGAFLDELRAFAGAGPPDREGRTDADWAQAIDERSHQLGVLLRDSPPGPPTRRVSLESPEPASTRLTIVAREGDAVRLLDVARRASEAYKHEQATETAARLELARRRDQLEVADLRLDRVLSLGGDATTAELITQLDRARTRVVESLGGDFRDREQLLAALAESEAEQIAAAESRLVIEALIREA